MGPRASRPWNATEKNVKDGDEINVSIILARIVKYVLVNFIIHYRATISDMISLLYRMFGAPTNN